VYIYIVCATSSSLLFIPNGRIQVEHIDVVREVIGFIKDKVKVL
jgi:hypothetical protein